jgi:hypothetical protein
MFPLAYRVGLAGWYFLLLLGISGCARPGSDRGAAGPQRYEDLAARFGEALVKGDYHAAYDLTSSRLQQRISLTEFKAAAEKAQADFGTPLKCAKVGFGKSDGLGGFKAAETLGFPPQIPDADRLAWLHATLAVEMDGDEVLRCYNCWLLVENESGREKVGHYDFVSCD